MTTSRLALITGVSGQDGTYLARSLIRDGYKVVGTTHGDASRALTNHIRLGLPQIDVRHLDLKSRVAIDELIAELQPEQIYHLGAQSEVQASFNHPVETAHASGISTLYFLESVRLRSPGTRIFHAASAEIFGDTVRDRQCEEGPFRPVTPYGVAKLFAHLTVGNFRRLFGTFAVSGILFNHESPLRSERFVSKKIVAGLVRAITHGGPAIGVGNIDARRDWGYAPEFVEGMRMSLAYDTPNDYVFATGEAHSVRGLIEVAAAMLGADIEWEGMGLDQVGRDRKSGRVLVYIDARFFRPSDMKVMKGDCSRAEHILGWQPQTKFAALVQLLVDAEIANAGGPAHSYEAATFSPLA